MRTDSAKPAPSLKRIIAHLKERSILFDEDEEGHQYIEVGIEDAEQILKALEAQPAAGRTALAEIRKRIERESYWCEDCQHEIPKGADYLDDLHADHEVVRITIIEGWLATEIDAQERAGAKAASEQEGA